MRTTSTRLHYRIVIAVLLLCLELWGTSARAQTASDDFNRANAASLGSDWTNIGTDETIAINSNQAFLASVSGALGYAVRSFETFGPDQSSQATLKSSTDVICGLLVRASNGGTALSGYLLYLSSFSNVVAVFRFTNGVADSLATLDASATFVANDIYRLSITGSTLKAYRNGIQIGSDVTDGTYSSGRPGLAIRAGAWDDWQGDAGVGPATRPPTMLLLGVG